MTFGQYLRQSLGLVTEAHEAMGSFDILALIEADGVTDLSPLLYRATYTMPGVYAAAVVVTTPP